MTCLAGKVYKSGGTVETFPCVFVGKVKREKKNWTPSFFVLANKRIRYFSIIVLHRINIESTVNITEGEVPIYTGSFPTHVPLLTGLQTHNIV